MRVPRSVALALLAALLGGCSTLRLAYDNADVWLRWRATSFLDVHGAEAEALDRHIAAFHAWHRAHALPRYAQLAESARERVQRGLSSEDLRWGHEAFRAHAREALRSAAAEIAPLLDRLSAEQIAHLEARLEEDNRRFEKEYLAGSREARLERRTRRTLERLEEWLGTLSEAQVERVRRYARETPLWDALRARSRRAMQAEFLALLRARQARARLPDLFARVAAVSEGDRGADYLAASRAQQASYSELLLDLDRMLTPAQRARAAERFAGYAEDFRRLAAPPPLAEAQR